jgi:capsular exopolysaccharide synthesis family protein
VRQLFLMPGNSTTAVAFCDIDEGGSSSWISACAADTLAHQIRQSICIADANFRNPTIHAHFGLNNEIGLTTALQHTCAVHRFTTRIADNLWVLSAGPPVDHSLNLSTPQELKVYIAELRNSYDLVLVNMAPVGVYSDALIIGHVLDGVVLVLEADLTRRESAQHAKDLLVQAEIATLGVVLNNRRFPIPSALYAKL